MESPGSESLLSLILTFPPVNTVIRKFTPIFYICAMAVAKRTFIRTVSLSLKFRIKVSSGFAISALPWVESQRNTEIIITQGEVDRSSLIKVYKEREVSQ